MSFVDDFIYKVKTGRLFSGSKSKLEMLEEQMNQQIEVLNTRMEGFAEAKKGLDLLAPKLEVLDEMDKEIMVLETKIESWKEKNSEETTTNEPDGIKENAPTTQPKVKKQIGPDVVIHFIFMNNTYIVENFNLNFKQDVNAYKNRPDSFTYGGTMQITLSGFLDPTLDEWLTQTYQTHEGEIHFFPNMPKITDSALLTIFFEGAYCTACNKSIDAVTSGVLTTLTISPRKIKIGNEEFENIWKQKEHLDFTIKSV